MYSVGLACDGLTRKRFYWNPQCKRIKGRQRETATLIIAGVVDEKDTKRLARDNNRKEDLEWLGVTLLKGYVPLSDKSQKKTILNSYVNNYTSNKKYLILRIINFVFSTLYHAQVGCVGPKATLQTTTQRTTST